jgi:hypothetical protein
LLLSKGSDVLAKRSEPMIYISSVNESKLIPASYTVEAPRKGDEKTKKAVITREGENSKAASSARVVKGTRSGKAPKSMKTASRTGGKKRAASGVTGKTAKKKYS